MENTDTPWYECDEFWRELKPFLFSLERWESTSEQVTQIIALLAIKGDDKILDLCCGPGRHSLELAARGFNVTGVDRTSSYLKEASEKAKSMGVEVEFTQEDMRKFCRPDSFDVALNMFSSFGYFEGPADDRNVLLNIYQSLKEGGKLLIEMMGKEILARDFLKRDWVEENGIILLEEREISCDWTRIDNRWIVIKGNKRKEFRFSLHLYSGAELTQLLSDSGFSSVEIFGDLLGSPYNNEAKRLVAIACK